MSTDSSLSPTPEAFCSRFGELKASAIVRAKDEEIAAQAMEAAYRGGFRILEFTMTTPGVLRLIERFAAKADVLVGAGTVLEVSQAREAVAAGARLLVSPVCDEKVIAEAASLGVAAMPGTHTATEMWRAHQAGAQLCKLFPAPAGGPAYLRSLRGPMPFLRVVPTNGVDIENGREWLDSGAHALGFVNSLFEPQWMAEGNFDAIEARAKAIVERLA